MMRSKFWRDAAGTLTFTAYTMLILLGGAAIQAKAYLCAVALLALAAFPSYFLGRAEARREWEEEH